MIRQFGINFHINECYISSLIEQSKNQKSRSALDRLYFCPKRRHCMLKLVRMSKSSFRLETTSCMRLNLFTEHLNHLPCFTDFQGRSPSTVGQSAERRSRIQEILRRFPFTYGRPEGGHSVSMYLSALVLVN